MKGSSFTQEQIATGLLLDKAMFQEIISKPKASPETKVGHVFARRLYNQ